jgi:hypothetical protein
LEHIVENASEYGDEDGGKHQKVESLLAKGFGFGVQEFLTFEI